MRLPVNRTLYRVLGFFGFPVAWDVSAGAIIFWEGDGTREYLLLCYPSGHFDYPRGHVEASETNEEAARREVREETGIEGVKVFLEKEMRTKFFYVAKGREEEHRKKEGRGVWIFKEVFMYPGQVPNKRVSLSHEHSEYVWLPYQEALEKVTFKNAKNLLRETETWLQREESHIP